MNGFSGNGHFVGFSVFEMNGYPFFLVGHNVRSEYVVGPVRPGRVR